MFEEYAERSEHDAKRDCPDCIVVRHRMKVHRTRTSTATRRKWHLVE
jgi:hypothetical protein